LSKSLRIRCWFHRLGNIRAKLPDDAAGEVMAHVRAIRDAATLDAARAAADRVIDTFSRQYPAAMACVADDLDALLAIHRLRIGIASSCAPPTWRSARSSRNAGAPR
jgi:transposase-like protein